jgi:hypothetical protein
MRELCERLFRVENVGVGHPVPGTGGASIGVV